MRDRLDQVSGGRAMAQRQLEFRQPEAHIGRGDGDPVRKRAPERCLAQLAAFLDLATRREAANEDR